MTKPEIAFVDHPFHRKTKSSNFFIDILKDEFSVHVYYLEPDPRALMEEIADRGYEFVVCWQSEFCAPYFLMRGMRVTCVPMYDGIANTPDWYWQPMRQARFICFCESLHRRLKAVEMESYLFKYYDSSLMDVPQARFDELRGFFWQRRPEEGLNWKWAHKVLGDVVSSMHFHNAPDFAEAEDWRPDPVVGTTSFLFSSDGGAYRDALERANILLCSRYAEGIGMALQDAIARGMCVVAHDGPTANEYIVDGTNGLLVDFGNEAACARRVRKKLGRDPKRAETLGRAARETYVLGCKQWDEASRQIPLLVRTAPVADLRESEKSYATPYLQACRFAVRDFHQYLGRLLKLCRKGLTGEEAFTIGLRERIRWRVKQVPGAAPVWRASRGLMESIRHAISR